MCWCLGESDKIWNAESSLQTRTLQKRWAHYKELEKKMLRSNTQAQMYNDMNNF